MVSDFELYAKLGTLAYEAGKGSASESMYDLFSKRQESRVLKFVGLHGKSSEDYFIAIHMGSEVIDVVLVNTVGKPKTVYIANIKEYDGRFSNYATNFLENNHGPEERVDILDEAKTIEVLEKSAEFAVDSIATKLKEYIDYLRG